MHHLGCYHQQIMYAAVTHSPTLRVVLTCKLCVQGAMETLKAAGLTTDASGGKGGAGAAGKAGGSGAKGSRPGSSGAAGKGGGGSKGGSKPPLAPPPRGPPGAATPLLGDRKVEAMLGIRKPA
jgi:hypothetical protein